MCMKTEAIFTWVTRGHFLEVGVKIDIEPNGGIFEAGPKKTTARHSIRKPLNLFSLNYASNCLHTTCGVSKVFTLT